MGRGRQKAKQQKIARKLKYLTTDTDYDELAKELKGEEPGAESTDSFADVQDGGESRDDEAQTASSPVSDEDLDEYARWAAEAAAKATSAEIPQVRTTPDRVVRKPIPMPRPHNVKGQSKQTAGD